jgi:hypothetical protein
MRQFSVLNKSRKPIGYLDVAALKEKWEAGKLIRSVLRHVSPVVQTRDLTDARTERKGIVVHDQVPTVDFNTLHRHHAADAFG